MHCSYMLHTTVRTAYRPPVEVRQARPGILRSSGNIIWLQIDYFNIRYCSDIRFRMFLYSLTSTPGLICCLLALAIIYFWKSHRSMKGLPPGPSGLPILGYLGLFKGGDPRPNIERLRKQYGDIFSLYIGSTLVVVVNGFS